MLAFFRDNLVGIDTSIDILHDIDLIRNMLELVFDPIEQNGTELIDIHLHKDFDKRFIIMRF
jgi:hypothetical protein